MIIGRITGATRTLGANQGYHTLWVRDEVIDGYASMVSAWLPNVDEIERLKEGGSVILRVLGNRHPAVHISVGFPDPDKRPTPEQAATLSAHRCVNSLVAEVREAGGGPNLQLEALQTVLAGVLLCVAASRGQAKTIADAMVAGLPAVMDRIENAGRGVKEDGQTG